MFHKSLPRAIVRSQRSFHSTPAARKVVATNPVKAEEVKVRTSTLPLQPRVYPDPRTVLVVWKIPFNRA